MTASTDAHPQRVQGTAFIHPAVDLLVIGGAMSLVFIAAMLATGVHANEEQLWEVLLLVNAAHFAASTVRLYSLPRVVRTRPILTLVLPVAVIAATLLFSGPWAKNAQLYLVAYSIWSPYHYAAQAFGLSMMYTGRSGCTLTPRQRWLVRLSCLAPFIFTVTGPYAAGWFYFGPRVYYSASPLSLILQPYLQAAALTAPIAAFGWLRFGAKVRVPFIAFLVVATNSIWWGLFDPLGAFIWATIFHGLQYLAIVAVFHVRDKVRTPGARWSPSFYVVTFYAACLVLGTMLFHVLPFAFPAIGWSAEPGLQVVVASINLHHFIVDGFIWKIRRDPNLQKVIGSREPIVTGSVPRAVGDVAIAPSQG